MKKRFKNPHAPKLRRHFWHFLLWRMGFYNNPYEQTFEVPKGFTFPGSVKLETGTPRLMWVNHSTFLLQYENIHILTDPIWSDSPVPLFGPKRKHPPGISLDELPFIDLVLLSHNHYDHMDKKTLFALNKRYPQIEWIVPKGVEPWFYKKGFSYVTPLGWNESKKIKKDPVTINIEAVPAQHFSGRCFFDTNRACWNGYVAELEGEEKSKRLYFLGDTGYNPYDFKEIGKKWEIDLALIPIGSFSPRKFMSAVHVNPSEAVDIHLDCKSKLSIAMHHKTFCLSDEPMDYPSYALYLALKEKKVSPEEFSVIMPGQYVSW